MSKNDILEIGVKLVGLYISINAFIELINYTSIYLMNWYNFSGQNISDSYIIYVVLIIRLAVGGGVWFLPNLIIDNDNSIIKSDVFSIKNVIVLFVVIFCFYTSFNGIIYLFQIIIDKSFYLRTSYDFQTKYPNGTIELNVLKIVISLLIIFYSEKILSFVNRNND